MSDLLGNSFSSLVAIFSHIPRFSIRILSLKLNVLHLN